MTEAWQDVAAAWVMPVGAGHAASEQLNVYGVSSPSEQLKDKAEAV